MTKRILFQIHWFLGITAGLVLALMGVTGATMSFEDEISEALSPRLYAPGVPAGPDLSPDQLIARVQADHPGYYIARLDWEMARDRSHSVRLSSSEGRGRKQGQVDRATGAWLGAPAGEGFFHLMDDLHRWLALPGGGNGIGRQITAFSAISLIFFALSGLYLRWPRQALDWRAWLVLDLRKTGRNLWRALHVVIGTWVLLFYLLSALTGLWWSYGWYREGLLALSGTPANAQRGRVTETLPGEPLDLQRQVGIVFDVNVDRSNCAADNADAAIRPAGPCGHLDFRGTALGMAVPFRVIRPSPALEAARLLRARADGQDGIAIGDEPRAEARHEGCVSHQKGTSGVMASRRLRSVAASSRRWSQYPVTTASMKRSHSVSVRVARSDLPMLSRYSPPIWPPTVIASASFGVGSIMPHLPWQMFWQSRLQRCFRLAARRGGLEDRVARLGLRQAAPQLGGVAVADQHVVGLAHGRRQHHRLSHSRSTINGQPHLG